MIQRERDGAVGDAVGLLAGRQLVVITNREPYVHRRTKRGIEVERPAGGLVAALDPVMQAAGGTWIAWGSGDADFEATDEAGRIRVPPTAPRYTLTRMPLTRDEVEGFYNGYANQALWPLCHMAMEHARFRRRHWAAYAAVNARFAEAAAAEAGHGAVVWLHDYHLARSPRLLRRARPDLFTLHFWHIPWPAWDIFRICPQRADLLDGLLANDVMVFQHLRHAEHFRECAVREVGARVEAGGAALEYQGRRTHVEVLPISVDSGGWTATSASPACLRWITRFRRGLRLENRQVAVSVDRLDYTKGILERLDAVEMFLRRYPSDRARVVFVQKCAPSRTRIKAYRELQRRVEVRLSELNRQYGSDGWQPLVYLPRSIPPAAMAALYRMADLCVVSSLQDGMNLVAKEFVACQIDRRGALVLSDLAGARDELRDALSINPYDPEGFAEALARGLDMSQDERRDRMDRLRAHVAAHDVQHWMRRHLALAARFLAPSASTPARPE